MKRWKKVERMIFVSVAFSIILIAFRVLYWGQMTFLFFAWNLFLAAIPLFISRKLLVSNKRITIGTLLIIGVWLLFLPNAPYIITDLFHLHERPPVPKWFDLLLIMSAAWNGLIMGIVSLFQMEEYLKKYFSEWKCNIIIITSIVACAFGIYLGRFLRFNSWDVITNPKALARQIGYPVLFPLNHVNMWAFTVFFGLLLAIVYYTLKQISSGGHKAKETV